MHLRCRGGAEAGAGAGFAPLSLLGAALLAGGIRPPAFLLPPGGVPEAALPQALLLRGGGPCDEYIVPSTSRTVASLAKPGSLAAGRRRRRQRLTASVPALHFDAGDSGGSENGSDGCGESDDGDDGASDDAGGMGVGEHGDGARGIGEGRPLRGGAPLPPTPSGSSSSGGADGGEYDASKDGNVAGPVTGGASGGGSTATGPGADAGDKGAAPPGGGPLPPSLSALLADSLPSSGSDFATAESEPGVLVIADLGLRQAGVNKKKGKKPAAANKGAGPARKSRLREKLQELPRR